jgi:hypothetical protein
MAAICHGESQQEDVPVVDGVSTARENQKGFEQVHSNVEY